MTAEEEYEIEIAAKQKEMSSDIAVSIERSTNAVAN